MPDKPEQTQATGAVKALSRFLNESEIDSLSAKEVRTQLSVAGVNMERVKKRFDSLIVEAKGRALLEGASERRQAFMDRMAEFRNRFVEGGDIRVQLSQFLQEVFGDRQEAAVAWRNFERASDSDLRSMLDDMTLLQELEKDDNPRADG